MKKIHPYRYMRPRRIEIMPKEPMSYSVSRHAEDPDIRYAFGYYSTAEQEHREVVEIDYAWLGAVFHILLADDGDDSRFHDIERAKDDVAEVKRLTKQVIQSFLLSNPERLQHILETIHDASREQGHLEVIKNAVSSMNVQLNLSDL